MANRTVTGPDAPPGAEAERPQEIPKRGWLQIAKRGWAEAQADQVPLLAAGVAFFGFLALFPTLLALVFLYGLIADPSTIAAQIDTLGGALPAEVKDLIVNQLTQQQQQASTGLTVGAALSLAVALWSASGGVTKLVTAVNAAYDESEDRSFVKKRGLALALTLGAIVFMIILIALVAVLPIVFSFFEGGPLRWLVQVARWVLIAGLVMVALAVLYRLAPDRDAPKLRWVSPGAVLATALWLLASFGFSIYVSTFASYAKTYGAIAGIVIVLLWLWLSAYAVLLGAEINAETEQQTIKDSTKGPAQPLGSRGAVKADTVLGEDRSDNANQDLASGRSSSDDDHRHEEGQTVSTHVPAGGASGPSGASAAVSSTGQTTRTVAPTGPADDSIAALIKQVTEESSRLVRTELRLAQVEMTDKAKTAGIGIGAFGAAGILALFGVGCLLATAILALALVLPAWLAALIVAVVVLAIAGVAALVGKKKVSQASPAVPSATVQNVKADVAEIKESVRK